MNKIMLIRHAEKPAADISGVSEHGNEDPDELSVRGWQRAGALVRYFAPFGGKFAHPTLATPGLVFAAAPTDHAKSLRSKHTAKPLADFLQTPLNLDHSKGDEKAVAKAALSVAGPVLIAWEHRAIPEIAKHICNDSLPYPKQWPDERFDMVLVFDRSADNQPWTFTQIPQLLLAGDSQTTFPL